MSMKKGFRRQKVAHLVLIGIWITSRRSSLYLGELMLRKLEALSRVKVNIFLAFRLCLEIVLFMFRERFWILKIMALSGLALLGKSIRNISKEVKFLWLNLIFWVLLGFILRNPKEVLDWRKTIMILSRLVLIAWQFFMTSAIKLSLSWMKRQKRAYKKCISANKRIVCKLVNRSFNFYLHFNFNYLLNFGNIML